MRTVGTILTPPVANDTYYQAVFSLNVTFYEVGEIDDSLLSFAVIAAKHQDTWVFCKHKNRDTWEVPGGHRDAGETILTAAKRELFEETGAREFELVPICIYSVSRAEESFGMLFFATIISFDPLPEFEIEKIGFFRNIPGPLTYPLIQPKLIQRVKEALCFT